MTINKAALICIATLTACPGRHAPVSDVAFADLPDAIEGTVLLLAGDFQRTSAGESFIGREQNDEERTVISKAMASENASLVVSLGDNVFNATSSEEWLEFDRLEYAFKDNHVPFITVLGNHEYWDNSKVGLIEAASRFPQLAQSPWYVRRIASLALVLIDTNRTEYESSAWAERLAWFQNTLQQFDEDPTIKSILVLGHHPPFTHSQVDGPHEWIREEICPRLRDSKKVLAYISGHSHGYERYNQEGIAYIVSGGAGGPRVTYATEENGGGRDLYSSAPEKRPFHYLKIEVLEQFLFITARGVDKGQGLEALRAIDSFELHYR